MLKLDKKRNIWCGPDVKTEKDIVELKGHGIKYVLSLQMGWIDFFFNKRRNEEAVMCINHGIVPIHIMMSNLWAPTQIELATALKILKKYDGVYFHCRRGKDRTGAVRALYRVAIQGWQIEDAIKEMNELGHAKKFFFWWHVDKIIASVVDRYQKGL